jgi:hypothetical protein
MKNSGGNQLVTNWFCLLPKGAEYYGTESKVIPKINYR